jgi:hypothetical protein
MAGSADLAGAVAFAGAAGALADGAAFAATLVDAGGLDATGGSGTELARVANAASEDCTKASDGSGFFASVGSTSQW